MKAYKGSQDFLVSTEILLVFTYTHNTGPYQFECFLFRTHFTFLKQIPVAVEYDPVNYYSFCFIVSEDFCIMLIYFIRKMVLALVSE